MTSTNSTHPWWYTFYHAHSWLVVYFAACLVQLCLAAVEKPSPMLAALALAANSSGGGGGSGSGRGSGSSSSDNDSGYPSRHHRRGVHVPPAPADRLSPSPPLLEGGGEGDMEGRLLGPTDPPPFHRPRLRRRLPALRGLHPPHPHNLCLGPRRRLDGADRPRRPLRAPCRRRPVPLPLR